MNKGDMQKTLTERSPSQAAQEVRVSMAVAYGNIWQWCWFLEQKISITGQ